MAENKTSFILRTETAATVEKLSDAKAGKLFKIIFDYVNDKNPVIDDILLQIAFEPIKQYLKRDLRKWDEFRQKQAENGKKGGRPKSQKKPKNPSLFLKTQKSLCVSVSDSVSDNSIIINDVLKIKNFNQMPKAEDVGELPEVKIGSAIEFLRITQQTEATKTDIEKLWKIFKIQNLTGKKFYQDIENVHSHFINWVKTQKIQKNTIPRATERSGPPLKTF